jgi:hypothetical protein
VLPAELGGNDLSCLKVSRGSHITMVDRPVQHQASQGFYKFGRWRQIGISDCIVQRVPFPVSVLRYALCAITIFPQ